MEKLLTPQDVADLLQISIGTVYSHARTLGGFYPFGIQVLRFRAEDIHERLEGMGGVTRPLPAQRDKIQRERLQNAERIIRSRGQAGKRAEAADAGEDRHGIFRYLTREGGKSNEV